MWNIHKYGIMHEKPGNYEIAHYRDQKALERALGTSHVSCNMTHTNIRVAYQKMGDTENAMIHLNIARPIIDSNTLENPFPDPSICRS